MNDGRLLASIRRLGGLQHHLLTLCVLRRRGRMHSDDPLFGKGKWGHDGFEALSKEPGHASMLW